MFQEKSVSLFILSTFGSIFESTSLDGWYNKRLSVEKKVEIVNTKVNEIDTKIYQLKQVKKILVEAIKDIENGNC